MFLTNPQGLDFIDLDPDLLSTPFDIQTNWCVVTGTVSSGKSTLINLLRKNGCRTVRETARHILEMEMARGRDIQEIHADGFTLQRNMKDLQLEVERSLPPEKRIFLDRAMPDFLAWYRVRGMDPNEILPECFHYRYATIFLLDPLPFQVDDQRVSEVATIAGFLAEWHLRDYQSLGYSIVQVPVLPPNDRMAFVLERASEIEWIDQVR